jgi:hypothetical protein
MKTETDLAGENRRLREALRGLTGLILDMKNVYQNPAADWLMKREPFVRAKAALSGEPVPPAQNWISVKERLPKERHEVLFVSRYYDEPSVELGFLCDGNQWQLIRTDSQDMPIVMEAEQVTHWQHLPVPPSAVSPQDREEQ